MSSSSYVRSVTHSCIDEFNKTISSVEKLVSEIPKNKARNELQTKLMVAKVKKERYEALSTVSRLKNLINELDIWLTQNELTNEVESLKRSRRAAEDDVQSRSKKPKLDDKNKAPKKHDSSDKKPKTISNKSVNENAKPQKPSSKSKDQPATKQNKSNKNSYRKGESAKTFKKPEAGLTKNKSKSINEDNKKNSKEIVLSHSPPCRDVECNNNGYIPTNVIKENTMHNQSEVFKDQPLIQPRDQKQKMLNEQCSTQKVDPKRNMKTETSNLNINLNLTQTLESQMKCIFNDTGYQESLVYENDQDTCNKETPESIEQTNIIYKEIMSRKAIKLEHDVKSVSSIETKKI